MASTPVHLGPRSALAACTAPEVALYLAPDGQVRTCCRNAEPVGYIGEQTLREIWEGTAIGAVRRALTEGRYEGGCGPCGHEVAIEGRANAYPAVFDELAPVAGGRWPARIEFNLSNACNLACLQCNGDLSSSVRIHRERRPRLPAAYGDAFFDEIAEFVPHLRTAQFAGGEPFLAEENYRMWDLVARLHPDLPVTVVTNATRWDRRVEEVVTNLRMGFALSIDSVDRSEYESIRHGADFDEVMANVGRFADAARANGAPITINWCLMAQNVAGFPQLLRFAEDRGIHVDVSVVRDPASCSVMSLDRDHRRAVVEDLERWDAALSAELVLNSEVWTTELVRLRGWAEADEATARAATQPLSVTVLGLPLVGAGPCSSEHALDELRTTWTNRPIRVIRVNRWNDIVAGDEDLDVLLGVEAQEVVGWNARRLAHLVGQHRGLSGEQAVRAAGPDRIDLVQASDAGALDVTLAVDRDADGVATGGRMIFVLPAPPSVGA